MANSFGPGDHNFQLRQDITNVASPYAASETRSNLNSHKNGDVTIAMYTSRTPSPTPSEQELLQRKGVIDWKKIMNWRFWIRREWLWYYVIFGIILTVVILVSVFDRQIVRWLQGPAMTIRNLPAGWLVPIAIFFIISFPPLFGHEILAILCGVVWGLWPGFAITAAGTFLGELGNFYAFKYCCRSRAEKLEKKDLQYACLAQVVRDGGFKVALIARYSAIPGHFTTAIFSTCGMGVIVFALAAALSLPKQFVTVYIGKILEESGTGTETTRDKIISDTVLAVTVLITGLAMWYMYKKMDGVKQSVIYNRRKARQAKLDRAQSLRGSSIFNPSESESDLPLNPGEDSAYQQWNTHGQATGFSGDPRFSQTLHIPTPQRPSSANLTRTPTYNDGSRGHSPSSPQYSQYGLPSVDLQASTPSSPSAASPAPHPNVQRHESGDSVGWDAAGTVGGEAYRLPTILPHTPLSGGFVNSRMSSNNPFNTHTLQQTPQAVPPVPDIPPPLAPPLSPNERSRNPYSPPTSPVQQPQYPTMSTPTTQKFSHQTFVAPPSVYGAPAAASPTLQQYPSDVYSTSLSSPLHTPTQFAYAAPANVYPTSQHSPSSPLPTPTQAVYATPPHPGQINTQPYGVHGVHSQPQSPAVSPAMYNVTAHISGSPIAQSPSGTTSSPAPAPNMAGIGVARTHIQESSDDSVYYTPAHSRFPTENPPNRVSPPEGPPPEYRP